MWSKYRAIRTNGFSSKLENAVYQILKLREKAGEISDIRQQDCVDLGFGIRWKVDFSFFMKNVTDKFFGKRVYVEAKGVKTERYRMCLKLWEGGQGPGPLEIWEGHYLKPMIKQIIIPKEK